MQQLRHPNLNIAYKGGWCLLAVRNAYTIPLKYATAMDDWKAGNKHTDSPPAGVSVPVYFSLGNEPAGHVAIHLPDGRVASSTLSGMHQGLYIHKNMADLIRIYSAANKSCTYLGWSEEVNDVPVVKGGEDMVIIVKPISQLNVTLKEQIMMWDIMTGKELWLSSHYMELTQKTSPVDGFVYMIPKDRAERGELYGFREAAVFDQASDIHDTQFDPVPGSQQDDIDAALVSINEAKEILENA